MAQGATIALMQGTNAHSSQGRCVVEPSRAEKARQRLAVLGAFLLGVAMLAQPTITVAADGDTPPLLCLLPLPTPACERRRSAARWSSMAAAPSNPVAAQSPNMRNQTPPPYLGFQPTPLYGSGWNTEYNSNGLTYTPWNR